MNSSLTFAIITPSFAPDFERCQLLVRSIQQFIQPRVNHYIIVPQRDLPLFRQLQSQHTIILTVESILPWWILRIPGFKSAWLSLKTLPIRGWIQQQLVKLSIPEQLTEDCLMFVDSDVAFIRPFQLQPALLRRSVQQEGDRTRLFRVANAQFLKQPNVLKWEVTAARLLNLSEQTSRHWYIGEINTWQRGHVLDLHRHIETISGKGWLETLCREVHLSEYVLYGMFIDGVLGDRANHFYDDSPLCQGYWLHDNLNDNQLKAFFKTVTPEHVAVLVASKANIEPWRYEPYIRDIQAVTASNKYES